MIKYWKPWKKSKIKEKESINSYINDKIKKLQKKKNKLLIKIHYLQRKWPAINTQRLSYLKNELNGQNKN